MDSLQKNRGAIKVNVSHPYPTFLLVSVFTNMEHLFFSECTVGINMVSGYVETVFEDEKVAPASPSPGLEIYSKDLGYGHDLRLLTIHNQILHTFLMEHFGHPYSPFLWAVAHEQESDGFWERAIVLSFQKYMNGRGVDPILENYEKELRKVKGAARKLLDFTYE